MQRNDFLRLFAEPSQPSYVQELEFLAGEPQYQILPPKLFKELTRYRDRSPHYLITAWELFRLRVKRGKAKIPTTREIDAYIFSLEQSCYFSQQK